jgi:hypothetical protein
MSFEDANNLTRPEFVQQCNQLPSFVNSNEPLDYIFFFGATAPIWALAYLNETLRFTSDF